MSLKSALELIGTHSKTFTEHAVQSSLPTDHEECYVLLKEYVTKGQISGDFFIREISKLTESKSAQQYLKLKAFW